MTTLLKVIFIGALFVNMLSMEVPVIAQTLLLWVPSVALAEIIRFVFLENIQWDEALVKLGSVLVISALLYVLVVWKIRRSDR